MSKGSGRTRRNLRILGVDPGFDRAGVAVLSCGKRGDELLFSGCLTTDSRRPFAERLRSLGDAFDEVLKRHLPEVVAVETLYFSKNQKTAIAVAEARGVLLFLAARRGIPIREFGPSEVKLAVTGYGGAAKADVARMLSRLLPALPRGMRDDEADAIAVALACRAVGRLSPAS